MITDLHVVARADDLARGRVRLRREDADLAEDLPRLARLRALAPDGEEVASKSGSLDALRSDVGIAYSAGGPVAIAITVDDMPRVDYSPDNEGNRLISDLARLIVADLGRPSLHR